MSTLINLADRADATEIIKRELNRCEIWSIEAPSSEGQTTVHGALRTPSGRITFKRADHYWIAKGLVPLEIARTLYAHRIGRTDIRVDGNCTCPAPEGHHIKWFLPSGRQVLSRADGVQATQMTKSESPIMQDVGRKILLESAFSDAPVHVGASPFIDCYHIDSELGLYIFVHAVLGQPW